MTLTEHATAWLVYFARFRAETTARRYQQALRSLLEALGDRDVDKLTREELRTWHGQRADKLKTNTLAVETVVVKRLLKEAKRADLADALESPRVNPDPKNIPVTWEQARRALRKAKEPHRSALLLMLNTGLRGGELEHLRPEDVEGNTIEVRARPGWKPKSRASTRTIPQSAEAKACLKKLKGTPHICELTRDEYAHALEEACERAGLDRLVPHDLRHLFITRHMQKKTHTEIISRLAGHSNLSMTMRHMHPTTGDLTKALKQIGQDGDGGQPLITSEE